MKKRPRDPNVLGKLIVDLATGQVAEVVAAKKDEQAAAMGRKGAASRAKNLSKKQRVEIARKAAKQRWKQDA